MGHKSYCSYAAFDDPDGVARLPGSLAGALAACEGAR
jgi:hypothetical protein